MIALLDGLAGSVCSSMLSFLYLHFTFVSSMAPLSRCLGRGNQGAPPGLSVDVLDLHSKMRQKAAGKASDQRRELLRLLGCY